MRDGRNGLTSVNRILTAIFSILGTSFLSTSLLAAPSPAMSPAVSSPAPLALTCPTRVGQVGVAYASSASASGGVMPYVFAAGAGALPTGLTLNTATGAITGTPTVAGTFNFSIKVTDASGSSVISNCLQSCLNTGASWNLSIPAGPLGTSQGYTANGITITAYGFLNSGAPKLLYGKNDGPDENGLGFAGTVDNEIDNTDFIQLDLTGAIDSGAHNAQMIVASVQTGESFDVYGSNTLGTIGVLLAGHVTLDGTPFSIPGYPNYKYVAVRGSTGNVAIASVSFTLGNCTITVAPAATQVPDVTISKNHMGNFRQGDTGDVYTLVVTSLGPAPTMGSVMVVDTLPAGLIGSAIGGAGWTCTLGTLTCTRSDTLAAGASYPAIVVTVNVASNAGAVLTNLATVSGGGEVNLSNDTATDTTPIIQTTIPPTQPDLTVGKSHAGTFREGDVGDIFTITVFNIGPAPTVGVVSVTDTFPAGLAATAISGSGWTCVFGTLTCTRSDVLAAGGAYPPIIVTVDVAAAAAGTFVNVATVSGGGEVNLTNDTAMDSVTVTPQPAQLTITKSHFGDFHLGDTGVTFTLTVANTGTGPTSGVILVSDQLPVGMTATAISGAGWACTLMTPFDPLGCMRSDSLAAGASFPIITLTVDIAANAQVCSDVQDPNGFQPGDLFLSMADGTVQWRHRDWSLAKVLTGITDGQAKGMAFAASGELLVTNWYGSNYTGNSVVRFDHDGNLIGLLGNNFDCNPTSIALDKQGNAFVGNSDCSAGVVQLDSLGNPLAKFNVAVENRGASHVAFGSDPCTLFYTSEGPDVKRFNVCTNTQMANFNVVPLPDPAAQQFSLLADGGMLVANFSLITQLDSAGNLVGTFNNAVSGDHCWLGMALDPDGISFWASNWCDSSVTRFDRTTGAVLESHVASDQRFMVKQIAVPPGICSTSLTNTATVTGASASDVTTILPPPPAPLPTGSVCGRFTGGGSIFVQGARVTHGFELHCDPSQKPNNLEINIGGSQFHLSDLTTASCTFDPNVGSPAPPAAPFNTLTATGQGQFTGQSGPVSIAFVITDAGEPGRNDTFGFTIRDANGNVLFFAPSTNLTFGNQQAHDCP